MKLYEILFEHFSQKDSETGLITYLVAESDEKVYEWLRSEPKIEGGNLSRLYTGYIYKEEDTFEVWDNNFNIIGEEDFKERMLRLKGEMFDEDKELNDLYYGLTLYGWNLVNGNVDENEIERLINLGIRVVIY